MDELQKVEANCYKIGTKLKLTPSTMNVIRAKKLHTAEALERIIETWLALNYNTEKHGPPTWKAIVEAVAHPGGGNNKALAMEIAKRHPGEGFGVVGRRGFGWRYQ